MKKVHTQLLLAAIVFSSFTAAAQKASTYNKNGVAIQGYDPVAFFTNHAAVKGAAEYVYQWNGVSWWFQNQAHLDSFKIAPEHYAPQYGGYCAYGTADGHKAPTEIDTWTIKDGKLYFNYNQKVKTIWVGDQQQFIQQADINWPAIKDKD